MQSQLTMKIRLKSGAHAIVGMVVVDDPKVPAPLEPDVCRGPTVPEYTEIARKVMKLDIESIAIGDHYE